MKGIIHAYEIQSFQAEKVLRGDLHKVVVKGYNTYPVYGMNEEVIMLTNKDEEEVGYVAVTGFLVAPAADISQKYIEECGFTQEEFDLYTNDFPIVTIVDVVPILTDAEACGCECDCDCEEDGEHPCKQGEACQCGGKCQVAA